MKPKKSKKEKTSNKTQISVAAQTGEGTKDDSADNNKQHACSSSRVKGCAKTKPKMVRMTSVSTQTSVEDRLNKSLLTVSASTKSDHKDQAAVLRRRSKTRENDDLDNAYFYLGVKDTQQSTTSLPKQSSTSLPKQLEAKDKIVGEIKSNDVQPSNTVTTPITNEAKSKEALPETTVNDQPNTVVEEKSETITESAPSNEKDLPLFLRKQMTNKKKRNSTKPPNPPAKIETIKTVAKTIIATVKQQKSTKPLPNRRFLNELEEEGIHQELFRNISKSPSPVNQSIAYDSDTDEYLIPEHFFDEKNNPNFKKDKKNVKAKIKGITRTKSKATQQFLNLPTLETAKIKTKDDLIAASNNIKACLNSSVLPTLTDTEPALSALKLDQYYMNSIKSPDLKNSRYWVHLNHFFNCNIVTCQGYKVFYNHFIEAGRINAQNIIIVIPGNRQITNYFEGLQTLLCPEFQNCLVCMNFLNHVMCIQRSCVCNSQWELFEVNTNFANFIEKTPLKGREYSIPPQKIKLLHKILLSNFNKIMKAYLEKAAKKINKPDAVSSPNTVQAGEAEMSQNTEQINTFEAGNVSRVSKDIVFQSILKIKDELQLFEKKVRDNKFEAELGQASISKVIENISKIKDDPEVQTVEDSNKSIELDVQGGENEIDPDTEEIQVDNFNTSQMEIIKNFELLSTSYNDKSINELPNEDKCITCGTKKNQSGTNSNEKSDAEGDIADNENELSGTMKQLIALDDLMYKRENNLLKIKDYSEGGSIDDLISKAKAELEEGLLASTKRFLVKELHKLQLTPVPLHQLAAIITELTDRAAVVYSCCSMLSPSTTPCESKTTQQMQAVSKIKIPAAVGAHSSTVIERNRGHTSICFKCKTEMETPEPLPEKKDIKVPFFCLIERPKNSYRIIKETKPNENEKMVHRPPNICHCKEKLTLKQKRSLAKGYTYNKTKKVRKITCNEINNTCCGSIVSCIRHAEVLDLNLVHVGSSNNRHIKCSWLLEFRNGKSVLKGMGRISVRKNIMVQDPEWQAKFCERMNKILSMDEESNNVELFPKFPWYTISN